MFESSSDRVVGWKFLPVIAAALLLGLFAGSAMAQTGTLTGVVTDASSGDPIEGALVVARGSMGGPHVEMGGGPGPGGGGHGMRHAYTGADGGYVIDELEPGDYVVSCGAPGYSVTSVDATIADGETTVVDFALQPLTFGAVAGLVTDLSTGLPIAGARVMLMVPMMPHAAITRGPSGDDGGDSMWLHAVTGDDGTYQIDNVPSGDYEARAMSWGYLRSDPVPVTVVEGETSQVDFELEPLTFGSLEGHVTDAITGEPIAGAMVFAFRQMPGMPGMPRIPGPGERGEAGEMGRWNFARTDADGYYRFDELAVGTWTIRAFAWNYSMGEGEAEVAANATTVVDLTLEPR